VNPPNKRKECWSYQFGEKRVPINENRRPFLALGLIFANMDMKKT
jgi:hypothetical protein